MPISKKEKGKGQGSHFFPIDLKVWSNLMTQKALESNSNLGKETLVGYEMGCSCVFSPTSSLVFSFNIQKKSSTVTMFSCVLKSSNFLSVKTIL